MNICMVHPFVSAGGAEHVVIYLAYNLMRLGHSVKIVTLTVNFENLPEIAQKLEYIVPEKDKLYPDKFYSRVKNYLSSLLQLKPPNEWLFFLSTQLLIKPPGWLIGVSLLRRLLKSCINNVDILNPHNFPAYWATSIFWKIKPIVWNCNEPFPLILQSFKWPQRHLRWYYKANAIVLSPADKYIVRKYVDKIIVLDKMNQRRVKWFYGRESIILHPGIDYEWYSKGDAYVARSKFNIEERDFVLLQVGWLLPQKNQITSIRVAKIISKEIPNFKLVLVGGGPSFYLNFLKSEVKRLGLEKKVIFTGFASREDLRNLYHACNINLFPCLDQSWGLTPFEALAAGKISIVSNECGAAEIISSQKIGIVVKPTPEMIAKFIIDIYKHPDKYTELINKGRKYVMHNMSWRNYAMKMLEIYKSVLSG
jgi:glycosyltransferase involved in cell wall biosynthesis